jgi:hypothetical protein
MSDEFTVPLSRGIARSIALVTKQLGGKRPASIRASPLVRYPWKHTRCRHFQIKQASMAGLPLRPAVILQMPGMRSCPPNGNEANCEKAAISQ